jgi:hypothetical protein
MRSTTIFAAAVAAACGVSSLPSVPPYTSPNKSLAGYNSTGLVLSPLALDNGTSIISELQSSLQKPQAFSGQNGKRANKVKMSSAMVVRITMQRCGGAGL